MSRITPDDYAAMAPEELRVAIVAKHSTMMEALRENQGLETELRRSEERGRQQEQTIERLNKEIKLLKSEIQDVVRERNTAQHLATSLLEKLAYLSGVTGKNPRDVKQVIMLYYHALEQVSRITAWPELSQWDFFNKIFTAAEERVFGDKKKVKKPTNARDFIDRSLTKAGVSRPAEKENEQCPASSSSTTPT